MPQLATIEQLRAWRASHTGSLGLVATMGALHEGHASLLRRSLDDNDATLCSIFVNPTQFAPSDDLHRYPRTLQADLELCRELGVHAVFTPTSAMMYPTGFRSWVEVEGLSDKLCGASRPGHFRGVTTVVAKLFNLARPTRAYFGQKDAQQGLILRRMALDLNFPLEVVLCPTVREPDGLAMSSRNRYLDAASRGRALSLFRALQSAGTGFAAGERDAATLKRAALAELEGNVDRVDYIEIVSAEDLSEVETIESQALLAIAAHVGGARLIDNTILAP